MSLRRARPPLAPRRRSRVDELFVFSEADLAAAALRPLFGALHIGAAGNSPPAKRARAGRAAAVVRVGVWDVETTAAIPADRDLTGLRISVASVLALDGEDHVLAPEAPLPDGATTTVRVGLGEPAQRLLEALEV